ncbi:very-short-patch-repair endonuclease [Cupriavidus metallidurans]
MKTMLGLAFLFAIVIVVVSRLKAAGRGGRSSTNFSFARRTPFLRHDEIQLFERLTAALIDTHIFPQVAMSAFVQHKGKSQAARNLFAQKYVDYLVCERKTMRPLYVVELDGASHGSAKAQKRDKQKNDVLASAGIPIMRYASKDVDLRTILRDYESVVSPRSTEGIGSSGSISEPKSRAVQPLA